MNYGFVKVAAAIPSVKVADCHYNTQQIIQQLEEAEKAGVEIVSCQLPLIPVRTCLHNSFCWKKVSKHFNSS